MIEIVVLVVIQVLFGVNFISSKFSLMVMDPFSFASFRFLVAGIVLGTYSFLFAKADKKLNAKMWKLIFLCALTGVAMGQSLFMWGIKFSGAINASVLSISIPLFTLLISYLRNQVQLNKFKIIGISGAFLGVLLLKSEDLLHWNSHSLIGDLCLLSACFSLGLFISLSKDLFSECSAMLGSSLIFLVGGTMLIPLGLGLQDIKFEMLFQNPYMISIIYSILGGTLMTYFLNGWVIKRVDPVKLSLFIYLQPIVASILAYMYLDESLTLFKIIASLIIFISVLVSLKETPNRKANG